MNADVRAAFETRLSDFAASYSEVIGTSWENVPFTPSSGMRYLHGFLMPATTQNPCLGTRFDRLVGFYQINVYGLQNFGAADSESIADAIIALFPRGSITQNETIVNIDTTGSRAQGLNDANGFYFVPVRIAYRQDVIS